jgi:hypothetical protein
MIDRLQPDDPFAIMRRYLRDLMRRCARDGTEQALIRAGQAASPLRLNWFLRFAASQPAARAALEKVPHLMREQSVAELEQMIEIAAGIGDPRAVGWRHLPWLLRTCRAYGLDAALRRRRSTRRTGPGAGAGKSARCNGRRRRPWRPSRRPARWIL